jgi:hypothetical protein
MVIKKQKIDSGTIDVRIKNRHRILSVFELSSILKLGRLHATKKLKTKEQAPDTKIAITKKIKFSINRNEIRNSAIANSETPKTTKLIFMSTPSWSASSTLKYLFASIKNSSLRVLANTVSQRVINHAVNRIDFRAIITVLDSARSSGSKIVKILRTIATNSRLVEIFFIVCSFLRFK